MGSDEFQLIEWVRARTKSSELVGIGDDAAVCAFGSPQTVLATDLLLEGTHFTFPDVTPEQAGRKALAVNLSDLAAMAAIPKAALVSLALTRDRGFSFAKQVMTGLLELAEQFDVAIIGGDTNIWSGPLAINVAVAGIPGPRGPILRRGAKTGDQLFVTGPLGGSAAGKHVSFVPRVKEAHTLSQLVQIHAMIDLSDGLAADLRHILDASNKGCRLFGDQIPISSGAIFSRAGGSSLERALGDGEDFELLFAVSSKDAAVLSSQSKIPCYPIGEVIRDAATRIIVSKDQSDIPLPQLGWKHRFAD
ncbi:MAG TPA: thiamine-phosphate kinase [Planctomycetaceae bacterium]|nr:thiamine-phosphate kinase [Planctomycetaceae bacterium]